MTTPSKRHTLIDSERHALDGAKPIGPAHPDERLEVTLRIRPKAAPKSDAPGARAILSRDEFAARHGAEPADLARIDAFAATHGLSVVESSAARRSVVLAGPVHSFERAFGVTLQQFQHPGGSYRGRTGTVSVPADLAQIVEGVFGLDDRPQASAHFQVFGAAKTAKAGPSVSYTPPQIAKLYDFPAGLDGSGQCIGIIELGGGFRPADLQAYFQGLGVPAPQVKAVLVDHAHNAPTTASGSDGEVMLDIEVAGAVAPKASIVVYFAPNTDQGFLDAITTAVHDSVNKPSVISISWGSPESQWTTQSMTQFDQAFQAAAAMGVTVCVAAGDRGSADGVKDKKPHVDFPASSPNALGCGGTKLLATGPKIASEVVWNEGTQSATGGGVSSFFPLPAYQDGVHLNPTAGAAPLPGRGVPDVAGDADPATGYQVRVDGQNLVIGGTSAVAPLWAGLVALLNQGLGHPVGFLNPQLYGALAGQGVCRDITSGNNGAYAAAPGWDACTGWGSPDGARLLSALAGGAAHKRKAK